MNHLIKLLAIFSIGFNVTAQTMSNVQIGPDNKQTSRIIKIFGTLGGKVYALGATSKNYYVQAYDPSSLNIVASEKMDIPDIDGLSKVEIEEFFLMENSLMVLFSGVNKANNSVELHAYKVGLDCKISTTGKQILSVETGRKKNNGDVGIEYNRSINRVLAFHQTKISNAAGYILSVASVDEEMKDIVKGTHMLAIPKGNPDYRVLDVLLARNGNIYVLDNNIRQEDEEGWKFKKQELHLVTFEKNGDSFNENEKIVSLDANYYITDAILYEQKARMAMTGFYVDVKNGKGIELDGAFNTEFQQDGSLEEPNIFSFTEEFKDKFDGRAINIAKSRIQESMRINVAHSVDGITYVVAENKYAVQGDETFDNILVYRISDGEKIDWAQAIAKRQTYVQVSVGFSASSGGAGNFGSSASANFKLISADVTNYLSYYSWIGGDNQLHVLFNDSKRNAELAGEGHRKPLVKPRDGVPTVATLSQDGQLKFEVEEAMQNEDIPIRVKYSLEEENTLYFVAGRNTVEALSKARLNR